jgi:hypothetical protein
MEILAKSRKKFGSAMIFTKPLCQNGFRVLGSRRSNRAMAMEQRDLLREGWRVNRKSVRGALER